ncbi:M48 family metalloprotease [Waterburya agarophytonicola K14]|uniref:M48 family metalloprotease n=1 Tax=Waterburya agarophytonicola KI4 TaxID=2874699 RepID=A0A964FFT7_9CYAN|nr:M48 family metallopeptidase [Waterburya agarophytonicola]MCC0177281.1 M48 family metalloprotease [Waterburya agarophytonicola KI4]
MIKFNQIVRNKFLLILFSCTLILSLGNRVDSQTSIIAQNFLNTNYGNNYYSAMLEADRFYKQGDLQTAKRIQQKVKPDFPASNSVPVAVSDIAKLPTVARQDWDTATQAIKEDPQDDKEVETRIFEPLESLVDNYPQFVPAHILLADTYDLYGWGDDALNTIEFASQMYPSREDILDKRIELLLAYGEPLEASIASREFVYSYPNSPKSSTYQSAADEYFKKYQSKLKSKIARNSVFGGIGQAAIGNEAQGINLGQMLLQGESATGTAIANSYKAQANMISDPVQLSYIRGIGNKLAKLMGRNEFEYEFNIIEDPTPNAFALPGGKIFFHTGMLELMDSEAELAGVMAHEVAHAVLSHGYKQLGESALTNTGMNILSGLAGREVGAIANVGGLLLDKKFSRGKEKQADVLGIRVLDAAGYSADGLYNVMAKLAQLEGEGNMAKSLLSSHPASKERMEYLEELIQTKGYNRYGYEGVAAYRGVFPR